MDDRLTIDVAAYVFVADRAWDGMARIVTTLGDELANSAPGLPGANSPYAVVTHCLGMAHWWVEHAILGNPVDRDRDAEFVATGDVVELVARVDAAKSWLADRVAGIDGAAAPHGEVGGRHAGDPDATTAGGILLHVLEELCQHHGQLELTRDMLLAAGA